MTPTDLSPCEWATLGAIRALDRVRVYPSGDRLAAKLEDWPEQTVRAARAYLLGSRAVTVATPDDDPSRAEPVPDGRGSCDDARGTRPLGPGRRNRDAEGRAFNHSLYAIVHGHKGIYRHLSVIVGLSPNALKCRVNAVAHSDDVPHDGGEHDHDMDRYLKRTYGGSNDKAVRDWLYQSSSARRRHPDGSRFREAVA